MVWTRETFVSVSMDKKDNEVEPLGQKGERRPQISWNDNIDEVMERRGLMKE